MPNPSEAPRGGSENGESADPVDERRFSDTNQSSSDADQTASDMDQTSSDSDQALADRDQRQADIEQDASDRDQAASDHELTSQPGDPQLVREAHDRSRDERIGGTIARTT